MMKTNIRISRLFALLLTVALLVSPMPQPLAHAATPVYRGLFIGNNTYDDGPLQGCVGDATNMRNALATSQSIQYSKLELKTNLTGNNILAALDNLSTWGQTDDDVTFFYYSGHGYSGAGIVGIDSKVSSGFISFSEVESRLGKVKGTVVVMLDSCYSGALIGKSVAASKAALAAYNAAAIRAFATSPKAKTLSGSKYHVITASSQTEESLEYGYPSTGTFFGLFTACVNEAMGWNRLTGSKYAEFHGDADNDGQLTIAEAYEYTAPVVNGIAAQDGESQNVQVYPTNSTLVFIDRKDSSAQPTPTPTPTPNPGTTPAPTPVPTPTPPSVYPILPGVSGLPNLTTAVIAPGWRYQLTYKNKLTWSSSKRSVATVDSSGVVTGVALGKAVIYGKKSGKTYVKLNVEVAQENLVCQELVLYPQTASYDAGIKFQLAAYASPDVLKNRNVRPFSANKSIATVNSSGVVTPIKPGTVKIYAISSSGVWDYCTLTVTPRKVTSVEQKKKTVNLRVGRVQKLSARALPAAATNKKLKWSSSDESIAVVGSTGIVRGRKKGNVYITATSTDGTDHSASVLVKVK